MTKSDHESVAVAIAFHGDHIATSAKTPFIGKFALKSNIVSMIVVWLFCIRDDPAQHRTHTVE